MQSLSQLYEVGRNIDTRAPGFSARVFRATHWQSGQDVAFKVLRSEHVDDPGVWECFAVEVALLEMLRNTGTVNRMVDCGYVSDGSHDRPAGGEILSCGREAEHFWRETSPRRAHRWRPYIALELLPEDHCLLNLIRGDDGEGRRPLRLPTEEALALAMQFAAFLREAHSRNIVYWDHKPEHVYWDGQRLRVIDLNVSRFLGPDLSQQSRAAEKRKDLRHSVAGVLYAAFTGRDFRFQDSAPQAMPSAPHTTEQRFDGLTGLNFGLDDCLLPALRDLMNEFVGSNSADLTADALLDRLRKVAAEVGWDTGYPANEAARAARREIQLGLVALRQAGASIGEARQHLLNAHLLNPADPESERLYREAGEFYRQRVLP